jgi:hypothetical protein
VYDVFNNIAQITNNIVSKNIEAPIQQAVQQTTNTLNNNSIVTGVDNFINGLNGNININYHSTPEETGMMDYKTAYTQLKQ